MDSLVSIIVPVFNSEKYLSKCLDSLLNQTYKNIEILIINDGSTDESSLICDKYAAIDNRIKVIHKNNEGVSVARNVGISLARGKWISFVDADDWVNQNMYELLVKEVQNYDLMFFENKEIFWDNSAKISSLFAFDSYDRTRIEEFILLLKSNCAHFEFFGYTWNKLFKNDIISHNNLRFQEGLSYREDEVFTLNYCKFIKSLKYLPLPLYNYRRQWTGLTGAKKNSEDYYLLGVSLKIVKQCFSNLELVNYDLDRGYKCLLTSINISENWVRALYLLRETWQYIHDYNIKPIGRRDELIFKYNFLWSKILFVIFSFFFTRKNVFSYIRFT